MVTSSKRGGAVARPATGRAGDVAAGVMHLVKSTVVTALAGASDVGAEMGNAAVGAVQPGARAGPAITWTWPSGTGAVYIEARPMGGLLSVHSKTTLDRAGKDIQERNDTIKDGF